MLWKLPVISLFFSIGVFVAFVISVVQSNYSPVNPHFGFESLILNPKMLLSLIFFLFFLIQIEYVNEFEVWQDLACLYSSLSLWKDVEACLAKAMALKPYSASTLHSKGNSEVLWPSIRFSVALSEPPIF